MNHDQIREIEAQMLPWEWPRAQTVHVFDYGDRPILFGFSAVRQHEMVAGPDMGPDMMHVTVNPPSQLDSRLQEALNLRSILGE